MSDDYVYMAIGTVAGGGVSKHEYYGNGTAECLGQEPTGIIANKKFFPMEPTEPPSRKLAQAIINMAEQDKGLTVAGIVDLINQHSQPSSKMEQILHYVVENAPLTTIENAGEMVLAELEEGTSYEFGYEKGYAKAIADMKAEEQEATHDLVHSIACTVLAKYRITEVYTEIFDHGGQIGIAAKHKGRRDAVRITDPDRAPQDGIKVSIQAIENAAFELANKLTGK